MANGATDVLESLWNKGLGVFEKWADLEIRETELELESQLALNRFQLQQVQQPKTTGFLPAGSAPVGGISLTTVALIGAGGLAAWFLLKKA